MKNKYILQRLYHQLRKNKISVGPTGLKIECTCSPLFFLNGQRLCPCFGQCDIYSVSIGF